MKKSLMIPAMVILLSQFVFAQNPQWKVYNHQNSGFPGGTIGRIAIEYDSASNNNIVWFSTHNGLTKFDGENWITYDSSSIGFHLIPSSIAIDKYKNKWLGSNKGAYMFDGVNWVNYNTTNSGIGFNFILDIFVDEYNVKWFGTGLGLSRFEGKRWKNYSMSNSGLPFVGVFVVTINKNERWLGHYNSGLARLVETKTDTTWTHFTTSNSGLNNNDIRGGIKIDSSGLVWLGTWGGLNVYNTVSNSWGLFPPGAAICLVIDKKNSKWIGTPGGGLFKLSHDSLITNFRPENSPLPSYTVTDLALDSSGNLWIGTGAGGLVVYNEDGVIGIEDPLVTEIPTVFKLYQNYPNPFNPISRIKFDVFRSGELKLEVFDIKGSQIKVLINSFLHPGEYEVGFDGSGLSSGVYLYKLEVNSYSETRRMLLFK